MPEETPKPTIERISMLAPDGSTWSFEPQDVDAAKAQGFKPMDAGPDVGGSIKAALLGYARGALPGVSDVVARGLGVLGPEEGRVLQEQHPVASGLGEVGGVLASPIGKVGKAAEAGIGATTVAGKIGAAATRGGLEMSLFGAGSAIKEDALGDAQLNGERLFSHMGMGALLGVGAGGLGGAVGEAATAARGVIAKALPEEAGFLSKAADSATLFAAGANKSTLRDVPLKERPALAQWLRQSGHIKAGGTPADVLSSIANAEDKVSFKTTSAAYEDIYKGLEQAGAKYDAGKFGAKADEWFKGLDAARQDAAEPALAQLKSQLERTGENFRDVSALKTSVARDLSFDPAAPLRSKMRAQLSGMLADDISEQMENSTWIAGPDMAARLPFVRQAWRRLEQTRAMAEDWVKRSQGNNPISLSGLIVGAGLTGGTGSLLSGIGGAIGTKLLKERAPSIISNLASHIEGSQLLSGVAEHFASDVGKKLGQLGSFAPSMDQALKLGASMALAHHIHTAATDDDYRTLSHAAGYAPASQEQVGQQLERMAAIHEVADTLKEHQNGLTSTIQHSVGGSGTPPSQTAVFRAQDFGAKRMRRDVAEGAEQRANEVASLADNPGALASRVQQSGGEIADHLPATYAQMAVTAGRAVQHLASVLPKKPTPTMLGPEHKMTAAAAHEFAKSLEVAQDSSSVLKHFKSGTLTPTHISALKAIYPRLEQEMAREVAHEMISKAYVPYQQRLMASMWLGADIDGTMSPGIIARNQASLAAPSSKQLAPRPTAHGLAKLSKADRLETPANTREAARD